MTSASYFSGMAAGSLTAGNLLQLSPQLPWVASAVVGAATFARAAVPIRAPPRRVEGVGTMGAG
eukprot:gene53317-65220_t